MTSYVYTAGISTATNINIRRYNFAGSSIDSISRSATIYALATDSINSFLYSAGVGTASGGDGGLRQYLNGTLQWDKNHGTTIYAVAANSTDVCIGGGRATGIDSKTTRKYTSSGTLSWSADHGDYVFAVAMDSAGNVYTGGSVSSSITTRKYNSSGTQQWTANHGSTVNGIAVDDSGNVYTCGASNGSYTMRKYNSSGTLQWSVDNFETDRAITVGADGYIYVCGFGYIKKYDSSGTEITTGGFPITSILDVRALQLDQDGNIYVAGPVNSSKTLWVFDSSGSLSWSANHTENCYALALLEPPPAVIVEPPGLDLEYGLGVPTIRATVQAPSLALGLALGIPSTTSNPLAPALSATPDSSIVYRLYITGGTLIEYPVSIIQCQRRLGQSTWIDVVIPNASTAMLADLYERKANDGRLAIYVGLRDSNGVETMGEFLQALMWDIDSDRMPRTGHIKVRGRLIPVSFSPQSVALTGVYRTGFDKELKHFAECDINPNLHPNDTVFDGSQSWTVGAIDYEITTRRAWMKVEEA